jgi:hypothetical protein
MGSHSNSWIRLLKNQKQWICVTRLHLREVAIIAETSCRQRNMSFATHCVKTQLNNLIVFGKESADVVWTETKIQQMRNAIAMFVASTGTNQ